MCVPVVFVVKKYAKTTNVIYIFNLDRLIVVTVHLQLCLWHMCRCLHLVGDNWAPE